MHRLAILVVFLACSGNKADPVPETKPSTQPAAKPETEPVTKPEAKPAAKPEAKPADDDPKARQAYRLGMRKGRKATDARKWAEAIAGFDEALAAKKGDARAHGERGYARLLEGKDLDAAARDFDTAAGATKDPKLLSEIWFNRGLLDEKRGNADNAQVAFATANTLRPTAAAQKKLAGRTGCSAIVERTLALSTSLETKLVTAEGWLELAKKLPWIEDPSTLEAALESLTGEKSEPSLPSTVIAGDHGEKIAYVVWRDTKKRLNALAVGAAMYGRCPGNLDFSATASAGNFIHVSGSELPEGGHTFMCEGKGDELVECAGTETEVAAGTACLGGNASRRDVLVDMRTGKIVLVVEQPSPTKDLKVKLSDGAFVLEGEGCSRTEKP